MKGRVAVWRMWERGDRRRSGRGTAVVVGAGLTGLTTALALDRRRVGVTVIEQRERPAARPGSVVFSREDLAVLDGLELLSEIHRASNPFARRVMNAGRAGLPKRFVAREVRGSRIISHSALGVILGEHARRRRIRIVTGQRVVGALQAPEEVRVDLSDGTQISAHWGIGADGPRSVVREAALPDAALQFADAWRVSGRASRSALSSRLAGVLEYDTAVVAAVGPVRFVAQADDPASGDLVSWHAHVATPELGARARRDPESRRTTVLRHVQDLLRAFAPDAHEIVTASQASVALPMMRTERSRPGAGRLLTVGRARAGDRSDRAVPTSAHLVEAALVPDRLHGTRADYRRLTSAGPDNGCSCDGGELRAQGVAPPRAARELCRHG